MAANPEDANVQLEDIFEGADVTGEVDIQEALEPDTEEPVTEPVQTSTPVEEAPANKPPITPKVEEVVVDTPKEETLVETPAMAPETPQNEPESKELGELKYLRDVVFSNEGLFNQVMKIAKGEPETPPEEAIVMPEFPSDDTDPEAMKKYYQEKDAAMQAQTQKQIQEALAAERKSNLAEQNKIRQQTVWSTAMNSVKTDNNLNQEQLDKFVQWAKNPFGNDAGKYVGSLYKLYEQVHTPETPKEKGSVLTEAAKNIQGKQTPAVNAANLGGGTPNQEPFSEEDQFNDELTKAVKGQRKW